MADVSGLILTVLGLSYRLASTIYSYSQDVKAASNSIQRLSNELFALIGVLEHVKLQRQQTIPASPTSKGEYNDSESLRRVLEDTLVFLQDLQASLEPRQGRLKVALQKLGWPLKEKDTKSNLERLERAKTYFILSQVTEEMLVYRIPILARVES